MLPRLVVDSAISQFDNFEDVVLIDDDSSTISACWAASTHPIIKQSNVNLASAGVKKQLYGIEKSHQELTKDRTVYLNRRFMYPVAQNKDKVKRWQM
jgi:hypothetical protein